jgi:hypothetical protein
MTILEAACYVLLAAAAATGMRLARRRGKQYRPVAILLCGELSLGLFGAFISPWIPNDPQQPPLQGIERALFHVDSAIHVADPIAVASVAVLVFTGRRPWAAIGVWAIAVVALVLAYPWARWEHLRQCYLAVELAALCVGCGAVATWLWRREPVRLEHTAMAMIIAIAFISVIFGPLRYGLFDRYDLAQIFQCILFFALSVVQAGAL